MNRKGRGQPGAWPCLVDPSGTRGPFILLGKRKRLFHETIPGVEDTGPAERTREGGTVESGSEAEDTSVQRKDSGALRGLKIRSHWQGQEIVHQCRIRVVPQ